MRFLLLLLLAPPGQPLGFNLNSPQPISRVVCDGGVVCWRDAGTITIIGTSTGGAPSSSDYDGGYNRVQDEGVDLTKRTTLDFTGAGVTCTDTGAKTSCDIPGGGGGASQSPLSIMLGTP